MKIKKKATISIIAVVAVLVVVISGLVYADLKKSTQSQSQVGSKEGLTVEDPYGKKQVLIDILNYSVRGDILGAEIGLNKEQVEQVVKIAHEEEDQSRELRWTKGLGAEEFNKRAYVIMKSSDEKLKQLLSPFQYVRFRDWIVEEWTLKINRGRKIYGEPLFVSKPITFYQMNFLQTQLKLSDEDTQTIKELIYQTKQKILSLREEFVGVMVDQSISLERMEEIGRQIAQKISLKARKLESDILKTLSLAKRKAYKSLVETPVGK